MKIVSSLTEVERDQKSIVTVGTYDGVHIAHQKIIGEAVQRARRAGGRCVVFTFDPHPRTVVGKNPKSAKLLSTIEERIVMFDKLGIDLLIILPFTYEFSRITSRQFYETYVVHGIGVEEVVEGYDHLFGRDREGGIEILRSMGKEFNFRVTIVEPIMIDGEIVSSSRIRKHLEAGEVGCVRKLLGRPYAVDGIVVEGDHRGSTIGFPTANIGGLADRKLIPANGVYAASCVIDGIEYFGMMNVGVRPTFKHDNARVIEIHIFDFQRNIYGQQVRLHFYEYLRPELQFDLPEELIARMKQDAVQVRTMFKTKIT